MHIFQRSTKFPRAQYYCHLCEYHCDTIEICINHIKDTRHSMLAKKQELDTTLFHLPRPNKKHLESLDNLLTRVVQEVGLSKSDLVKREHVSGRVNELMKLHIPGNFSIIHPRINHKRPWTCTVRFDNHMFQVLL